MTESAVSEAAMPGPGRQIAPSRMLQLWLTQEGMSQVALSERTNGVLDHRQISDVAGDRKAVTIVTAVLLEIATGIPAKEWMWSYWQVVVPGLRSTLERMIADGGRPAGYHSRHPEVVAAASPHGRMATGKLPRSPNPRKPARKKPARKKTP